MFIKLLRKITIVLLALNFLACSFLASATPAANAADIEKEEQAVYAFFVSGYTGTAVIIQNTSTSISSDDPQESIDYIKSGLPSVSNETINNYLERNAQPSQFSSDMQLGIK